MIVVDTSVWAAYFNGRDIPEVSFLDDTMANDSDTVAVLPIILTEVLQGFRSEQGFTRARSSLLALAPLSPSIHTHVAAAALYLRLRRRGVTVRGAVDCLIAQTCIEQRAGLLTLDRDFQRIAWHAPLAVIGFGGPTA